MLKTTRILLEAAKKSSERLKELGDKGKKYVKRGASGDLSLMGDIISEKTIIEYLRNSLEPFTAITEEEGEIKFGNGDYLIIDPIDGSTNYKIGLAPYTISIAASKTGFMSGIYSGIVYELTTGKYFWAERGSGAYFLNKRIYGNKSNEGPFIVSINFSNRYSGRIASSLKKALGNNVKIRAIGSASWESCLVAKGLLDAYLECWNSLRVVDIAASFLILRESGIPVILDLRDRDPKLSLKERVSFIASRSDEILRIVLDSLS